MRKYEYKDLPKANELRAKINELDYFLTTIDVTEIGARHVKMILKKKAKTSFSIFGSRCFGYETHISEIETPNCLAPLIAKIAEEYKKQLSDELEKI